jgi:mannose-1-phosphate guanylyltransferase
MLQETVSRLTPIIPIENIVIVTGDSHAEQARDQLTELPSSNVLVEPAARGTAPAIGLALTYIARLAKARGESDPVIGSFHADHIITRPVEFQNIVLEAARVAKQGFIVTLGITPDQPHTGYGYIERGEELTATEVEGQSIYRVARFVEKPPRATAEEYLATGRYSWNSGMFIWQLSTVLGEYAKHQPKLYQQLQQIEAAVGEPDAELILNRVWNEMRTETIDVGIAEKSQQMAVIPADFGWSDVGDWSVVAELLAAQGSDTNNNAVIGTHFGLDTSNSLVYSSLEGKLVATIGLNNIVIVDTGDVLLVCDRNRNQDVKKVVEKLKEQGLTHWL